MSRRRWTLWHRRWQWTYFYANGYRVVLTRLGGGGDRGKWEVEVSGSYTRTWLKYFDTRREARAYLRRIRVAETSDPRRVLPVGIQRLPPSHIGPISLRAFAKDWDQRVTR